jgi:hypothetical protein
MTDVQIIQALGSRCPRVKILNLVLRKNYADGLLTGEAKVIFEKAQDVNDIRAILPLEISFRLPQTSTLKTAQLIEKNPYQTEKAIKKLHQLEREGLIQNQHFLKTKNSPLVTGNLNSCFHSPVSRSPQNPSFSDRELTSESQQHSFQNSFLEVLESLQSYNKVPRHQEYFFNRINKQQGMVVPRFSQQVRYNKYC